MRILQLRKIYWKLLTNAGMTFHGEQCHQNSHRAIIRPMDRLPGCSDTLRTVTVKFHHAQISLRIFHVWRWKHVRRPQNSVPRTVRSMAAIFVFGRLNDSCLE
jgi:hypothetical protein